MDTLRPICCLCNQRPCKPSKKYKSGFIKFCSSCEQKHYGIWDTRKSKLYHKRSRYKKIETRARNRVLKSIGATLSVPPTCPLCGFAPSHICQMDLDHIDTNHNNNDPENLQLICPNCHRLKTLLERQL